MIESCGSSPVTYLLLQPFHSIRDPAQRVGIQISSDFLGPLTTTFWLDVHNRKVPCLSASNTMTGLPTFAHCVVRNPVIALHYAWMMKKECVFMWDR